MNDLSNANATRSSLGLFDSARSAPPPTDNSPADARTYMEERILQHKEYLRAAKSAHSELDALSSLNAQLSKLKGAS